MFPLVALLASFGIVMIYRIDATLARQQAQWFVLGLILFAATIVAFRDYRKLERYRYMIVVRLARPAAAAAAARASATRPTAPTSACASPALFVFQPAEFAKIGLVIFLASYLRDTRQVLVMGARRILGVTIPPIKHFGPVLVIWGIAMLILVLLHDIGSSLMFYGGLLAVLYVATGPALVRGRRAGRVRARRLVPRHPHPARPRPRRGVAASVQPAPLQQGRRQLPGRQLDVRPGRRRDVRPGVRPGGADHPGHARSTCCPRRRRT